MTIEGMIDLEVMQRLSLHGTIKGMDSYALHLLKTSNHPLLRFRRSWMRKEAINQCLEAEREQKIMNDQLAAEPAVRRGALRRAAVLSPYYAAKEPRKHGASLNDKDFLGSMKRDNPKIFPKRT